MATWRGAVAVRGAIRTDSVSARRHKMGVIGYGQVHAHHRHQGIAGTRHHPIREFEQQLQGAQGLNGDIRVAGGRSLPTRWCR